MCASGGAGRWGQGPRPTLLGHEPGPHGLVPNNRRIVPS